MPINNKLLEGVNMGDAKNITTGKSLTGGKGYLDVDASKKVAPATGTGYAKQAANVIIEKKDTLAELLKATK